VWRIPEPGSSRRLSQLSRQRPLEASRDAERPNLPCCRWKSRHEAARGLKRAGAIGGIPPDRAAKSPSFPKSRALPINRTYSLSARGIPRRCADYRCAGHTFVSGGPNYHPFSTDSPPRTPASRPSAVLENGKILEKRQDRLRVPIHRTYLRDARRHATDSPDT
jgi:hypothetical protein